MDANKTTLIYQGKNLLEEGATFVAIQTETQPPYIFAFYFSRDKKELPTLGTDMLILPADMAERLFDIKEGRLEDLIQK